MPKNMRMTTTLSDKLLKTLKRKTKKSKVRRKLVFKHPIDLLRPKALSNLSIINEDDTDTEADKSYYDATNGQTIDEEWHTWFCYACGYDREYEEGPCEACGTKYTNFFK